MWLYLLFRAWLAKLDPFQRARAAALRLLEVVLKGLLDERGALRPLDDNLRAKIFGALLFAEHGVRVCAAIKAKTPRPIYAPPSADDAISSAFLMLRRARAAIRALHALEASISATPGCVRSLRKMCSAADLNAFVECALLSAGLTRALFERCNNRACREDGGASAPDPLTGAKARDPPAWSPRHTIKIITPPEAALRRGRPRMGKRPDRFQEKCERFSARRAV